MTREELHAEVDREWKAVLDAAVQAEPLNCWAHWGVLQLWREEKEYVDRYGQRYPQVRFSSAALTSPALPPG
jgi:hypothetical protein